MIDLLQKNEIFAIPLWKCTLPNFQDLKSCMIEYVHAVRKNDPIGSSRSNFFGYQKDIALSCQEMSPLTFQIQQILPRIIDDCQLEVNPRQSINGWINVNDKVGSYNFIHTHDGTFSGVFYLSAPPQSGDLILMNSGINELWKGSALNKKQNKPNKYLSHFNKIEPQEGDIYIWQSFLPHQVTPNMSGLERIAISFNITLFHKDQKFN